MFSGLSVVFSGLSVVFSGLSVVFPEIPDCSGCPSIHPAEKVIKIMNRMKTILLIESPSLFTPFGFTAFNFLLRSEN